MKFKILQSFKFAHGGVEVTEYFEGEEVDVEDAEFESIAVGEGWAAIAGTGEPPSNPTPPSDPEQQAESGGGEPAEIQAAEESAPEKPKPARKKSEE